jgi:hypothetical protein
MFVVAAALNVGFWARNIQTFGGLYGPPDVLQRNLWIRFLPADEAGEPTDLESGPPEGQAFPREPSLSGTPEAQQPPGEWLPSQPPRNAAFNWARRVLRTAAYNLVTPSFALNRVLETALRSVPSVFDEAYLVDWRNVAWNHEDTASSPIHFGLILVCLAAILVTRPANGLRQTKVYAGLVALTFGMLPVVIGHAPSIWGIRYQLPFFLLASPLPGMLLAQRPRLWPSVILGAGLLLSAIPLLLFNNTRPLVGRPPWPTRVGSILTTPASDLVFAITPATQESYEGATELLRASECRDIGLRLDSGDLEYIFWWLLQAPQSGFRLQTLYTVPRLQFLVDREFRPCAILCTICGERTRVHGLTRIADYPFVDVFAGSSFVWEEDG